MSEKILFKTNTVYTKEKMIQYFKSKSTINESYFWEFVMCLYGCFLLTKGDFFLGIALLSMGIICTLIEYNKKPKIEAQNFANMMDEQFHTTEINQEISFTDNSIKIKNLTSGANAEMFYDQITRLIDKKGFYGLIFRYSNIFIDKNCFVEGNELEFKEFINQKLNRKTNKKLDRAFKTSVIFLIMFFGLIIYVSFLPEDTKDEFSQNYASMDQIYQTLSADDSKVAEGYSIPEEFLERYPDVVSLILNSMSLENSEEKQKWFDMFYLMNDEQISELRDILTREKEKLAEIEEKYNVEISEDYVNNQGNSGETL